MVGGPTARRGGSVWRSAISTGWCGCCGAGTGASGLVQRVGRRPGTEPASGLRFGDSQTSTTGAKSNAVNAIATGTHRDIGIRAQVGECTERGGQHDRVDARPMPGR